MGRFDASSKVNFYLSRIFNPLIKNSWKKYVGLTATYIGAGTAFAFATVTAQNVIYANFKYLATALGNY